MNEVTLTADERHKLLAVLRDLDGKAPTEKRKSPRRKVQLELWIRPVSKKAPGLIRSVLLDVSARGVALVTGRGMERADRFVMPLRFREGGGWLILCEVRNAASISRGKYKVGARIVDRIDDPDGNSKPPLDWLI